MQNSIDHIILNIYYQKKIFNIQFLYKLYFPFIIDDK